MNQNDSTKIAKYINSLIDGNPMEYLQKNSTWFSEDLVLSSHKNKYPYLQLQYNNFFFDTKISKFVKDVGLKFIVNEDINDSSKDIKLISKWIIKIWGGIKGIGDTTITDIIENINSKEYPFKNISSWSKVHSFKNIDTDIIYDSKVIYSMNWLILQLQNNEYKFFHQPMGRNKKLTTFPMDAIINYKYSDLIDMKKRGEKATEKVYHSQSEVYTKYKDIIHSINSELWGNESIDLSKINGKIIYMKDYPFFTELLLFNMADDVIFQDIREKVLVKIS